MPQIEQLPYIFTSQVFWLLLVFGIIYFAIGRGMVPKIQAVVDQRDSKIADDLAAAQQAREDAEQAEAAYRQRLDASRAEAAKLAQAAKATGQKETEERLKLIEAEIGGRAAEAEQRIRRAVGEAMAEIELVAAEAARDLVGKLTGASVSDDEARQAVKVALHG
jgi:F-type H+-transporting ATPase subunit b